MIRTKGKRLRLSATSCTFSICYRVFCHQMSYSYVDGWSLVGSTRSLGQRILGDSKDFLYIKPPRYDNFPTFSHSAGKLNYLFDTLTNAAVCYETYSY